MEQMQLSLWRSAAGRPVGGGQSIVNLEAHVPITIDGAGHDARQLAREVGVQVKTELRALARDVELSTR